jgi:type II secretion system protein G
MQKGKNGFTLIELLGVISIIAILLALGVAGQSLARRNAKVARTRAELEMIRVALEEYRVAYGAYPALEPAGTLEELLGSLEAEEVQCLTHAVERFPLRDVWGRDYLYFRADDEQESLVYRVWSQGADPEDEQDDIR